MPKPTKDEIEQEATEALAEFFATYEPPEYGEENW